jgi:hypothetical protein
MCRSCYRYRNVRDPQIALRVHSVLLREIVAAQ